MGASSRLLLDLLGLAVQYAIDLPIPGAPEEHPYTAANRVIFQQ